MQLDVIWQQTFLSMQQLLCWNVELFSFAGAHWNFSTNNQDLKLKLYNYLPSILALIVGDLLAIRSCLSGAVGRFHNLTSECFGHLSCLGRFRFMIPQLLFVGA